MELSRRDFEWAQAAVRTLLREAINALCNQLRALIERAG